MRGFTVADFSILGLGVCLFYDYWAGSSADLPRKKNLQEFTSDN